MSIFNPHPQVFQRTLTSATPFIFSKHFIFLSMIFHNNNNKLGRALLVTFTTLWFVLHILRPCSKFSWWNLVFGSVSCWKVCLISSSVRSELSRAVWRLKGPSKPLQKHSCLFDSPEISSLALKYLDWLGSNSSTIPYPNSE